MENKIELDSLVKREILTVKKLIENNRWEPKREN